MGVKYLAVDPPALVAPDEHEEIGVAGAAPVERFEPGHGSTSGMFHRHHPRLQPRHGAALGDGVAELGQRPAHRLAAVAEPIDEGVLTRYRDEYEELTKQCPYNHDPVDDVLFRAQKPDDFKDASGNAQFGFRGWLWAHARYGLSSIVYFGIFWVVIACLLWVLWVTPWGSVPKGHHMHGGAVQPVTERPPARTESKQ